MQYYEDYWQITNAYTDYNGQKFIDSLKICIEFIEEFKEEEYSENKYSRLQDRLFCKTGIAHISIRKAINQFVKFGFIGSFLKSYSPDSIEYINARSNKKRQILLSKIVYSGSSLSRSVNKESNLHQLNFLIKTLIENGHISKDDIVALMLVNIEAVSKGYLSRSELDTYLERARASGFIERKYNQISHLCNLLGKLDDLVFVGNDLYFEEDAKQIFGDEIKDAGRARDPYLHRLYKNQLKEESRELYGNVKCMLEKVAYPILVASHIKPFICSNDVEAYDPNNGLLLSRTIDSLFDLKYISFNDDGSILFSNKLSKDVICKIGEYRLDSSILNESRREFLKYHRNTVI